VSGTGSRAVLSLHGIHVNQQARYSPEKAQWQATEQQTLLNSQDDRFRDLEARLVEGSCCISSMVSQLVMES